MLRPITLTIIGLSILGLAVLASIYTNKTPQLTENVGWLELQEIIKNCQVKSTLETHQGLREGYFEVVLKSGVQLRVGSDLKERVNEAITKYTGRCGSPVRAIE